MATKEALTQPADVRRICGGCGWREFRIIPQSFLNKLVALQLYRCARCGSVSPRIRIGPYLAVIPLVLALLIGGVILVRRNLPRPRGGGSEALSAAESLSRARQAAGGQLSPFEQMMLHKPRSVLDNATIRKLVDAKVGTAVILLLIRTSTPDFDLSANAIIELKHAGVDQDVILAMIDASYNNR